jgi:hypothetical protein
MRMTALFLTLTFSLAWDIPRKRTAHPMWPWDHNTIRSTSR